MARPAARFDAARYFRGAGDLGFFNVGTPAMRALARSIHGARRGDWSIEDAMAFSGMLIRDLIQKAVGWTLREAGTIDPDRLERYRRTEGPRIPRTRVRYAIERFPPEEREALLKATRREANDGR